MPQWIRRGARGSIRGGGRRRPERLRSTRKRWRSAVWIRCLLICRKPKAWPTASRSHVSRCRYLALLRITLSAQVSSTCHGCRKCCRGRRLRSVRRMRASAALKPAIGADFTMTAGKRLALHTSSTDFCPASSARPSSYRVHG